MQSEKKRKLNDAEETGKLKKVKLKKKNRTFDHGSTTRETHDVIIRSEPENRPVKIKTSSANKTVPTSKAQLEHTNLKDELTNATQGKKKRNKKHATDKNKSQAKAFTTDSSDHDKTHETAQKASNMNHLGKGDRKYSKKQKLEADLTVANRNETLSEESSHKAIKLNYNKIEKKRKRKIENEKDIKRCPEKHRKTVSDKTLDYGTSERKPSKIDVTNSETAKIGRTPLTDRQKHKRWKMKQKRKLKKLGKDNKTEQTKTEQSSAADLKSIKDEVHKHAYEKFVLPKGPEDASSNWKKLHSILEAKKRDTGGEGKKTKPHPYKHNPKKEKKERKKKEDKQEAQKSVKPTEKSAPEIWFDDVDEIYLEPGMRSKPMEQGTIPEVSGDNNVKKMSVPRNPLVKPDAYKGLTKVVSMDCEMVGVGDGNENMLARVSVVNQHGEMVYDKFVKPMETVVDYRTHVSGVRREDMENGEEFSDVQKDVAEILKGRLLVGHALENDLKVLYLSHPRKRIRDTSRYKPFRHLFQGRTPSLKKLTAQVLNVKVQEGEHNSVQDAQAAMRLYTRYRQQWEAEIAKKRKKIPEKGKDKQTLLVDKIWNKPMVKKKKRR